MKDLSQITACVIDHGLFLPLALKLGETYKRVLYHTPWERDFPTVNQCVIGDGFERIERCDDFWAHRDEIDLFVFPDILHGGLQLELERRGFPVWGSRQAQTLETNREKFHEVLAEVGLEVPVFKVIVGVTALAEHLRHQSDKIIKISKFRGSIETCKWRDYSVDAGMLDSWAVQFGPCKDLVRFLVFDKIETDIELGCDTFNVRGRWPRQMIQGYEAKDAGFLSTVKPTSEMPDQVKQVLDAFGPILGGYNYANSFSMEIRVQDEKSYFIDPCCRFPMPPTGSKTEIWTNLAEVIAAGAEGELIEPETSAQYAAEVAVKLCGDKKEWRVTEVPDTLKRWLKFSNCCEIDDRLCFPPLEFSEDKVGWLVATADDLDTLIENLLDHVAQLPPGLSTDTQPIVELLAQVRTAEAQGIEFSNERIPEPAAALATN